MKRIALILLVMTTTAAAFAQDKSTRKDGVADSNDDSNVVYYDADDTGMNRAIASARATVAAFAASIGALDAEGAYYSVKAPVATSGGTEHIWLENLVFEDGRFSGTLGNDPVAPEIAYGDAHSLPADEVSDWIAIRDGKLYGGFSIHLMRNQLAPEEQAAFDESFGVEMPPEPATF